MITAADIIEGIAGWVIIAAAVVNAVVDVVAMMVAAAGVMAVSVEATEGRRVLKQMVLRIS